VFGKAIYALVPSSFNVKRRPLAILGVAATSLILAVSGVLFWVLRPQDNMVVLDTDRDSYPVGQFVLVMLRNERSDEILLYSTDPYAIECDINGTWWLVEEHLSAQKVVVIRPGETSWWLWKAETQDGTTGLAPVVPGLYRFRLEVVVQGQAIELSTFFHLV